MTIPKRRDLIYSLEKGLSILSFFCQLGPELSLSELAKAANMGLGNTTRYVKTLVELGYLTRDQITKKYRLAPKILSLGFSMLKEMDLRARITPRIAEVTKEFGVGSQCAILDDTDIIYIERFRSNAIVTLDLTVGSRLPAHCTALGRAILAFMDVDAMQRLVAKINLTPLTPFTITDRDKLLHELELTRQRGYAINQQELVLGQSALAAPVLRRGLVEGAFGFSFPPHVIEDEGFKSTLIKRMMIISREVSIE